VAAEEISRRISRRDLLTRGAALGVGATVLGGGLAGEAFAAAERLAASGTKLNVWSWQSTGGYPKVFDAVGKQFAKQYAGSSVKYAYFPYASYFTKFKTAAAGGAVPDMLEMEWSGNYRAAVDAGTLLDLTSALKTGFPSFYTTAMDQMRYKNRIWGIPMDLNTLTIAYNKDIFAKLGLKIPTTLDELLALVPKIKAGGYEPMSVNIKDGWPDGDLWFAQVAYTDPSGTAIRRAEAKQLPWTAAPFVNAASNVQRMASAGLFSQGSPSLDFVGAYTEFATGKSAMLYPVGNFGTPVIDSIGKGKINYGLFAFPPMSAGGTPKATGGAAIIWSVPSKTKNADVALELARVFSGPFGTKTLIAANYIPAFKANISSNHSLIYKRMVQFQATAATRSLFVPKVYSALLNAMTSVASGNGSAQSVVSAMAAAAK
jgi:raffinose/stachyose/melibiose transport system substrate-binding protein